MTTRNDQSSCKLFKQILLTSDESVMVHGTMKDSKCEDIKRLSLRILKLVILRTNAVTPPQAGVFGVLDQLTTCGESVQQRVIQHGFPPRVARRKIINFNHDFKWGTGCGERNALRFSCIYCPRARCPFFIAIIWGRFLPIEMAELKFVMTERMGRDQRLCFCLVWFTLGLALCLFLPGIDCLCSLRDSQALLALKNESQSGALSSWRPGSDCCRGWAGVTCEATGTDVVKLKLTDDLQLGGGNVFESLCSLNELEALKISFADTAGDLEGDFLQKQLPACIWNMTEIRSLTIITREGVAFRGPLPAEVCKRAHLRHLQVSMEGDIPDCVWGMTKLHFLDLGAANVSQSFSSQVCNLNLTHLAVGKYQEIEGTPVEVAARLAIPDCIWSMTGLEYLRLSGFTLPSSISSDVCNLVNLAYFDVGFSSLYGEIPQCIWSLTNLKHLGVRGQGPGLAFRGTFSSDVCNLRNLSYLSITGLTIADGYIPACIWNLTGLKSLQVSLEDLQLPGSFSSQMCKLTKLQELQIPFTDFTGRLPACFWNMTRLKVVDLTGLDLSDMEHPSQVFMPFLHYLLVGSTNVTAGLLDAVGNLSALQLLDISGNGITSLPDGIQNLHHLYHLHAGTNNITTVPAWIGGLQNLSYLQLANNTVTSLRSASGSSFISPQTDMDMPTVFLNLSRLETLDLSINSITDLPPSLLNLSRLSYLDLGHNHLKTVSLSRQNRGNPCRVNLEWNSLTIQNITLKGPGIDSLDLSTNLLNVSTPIHWQLNLSGVTALNLEHNKLRSLPTGITDSSDLELLALSVNLLETVPPLVSVATNLKFLYFQSNRLQDIWGMCPLEKVELLNVGNNYLGSSQAGVSSLACVKNMTRLSRLRLRNNTIPGDLRALLSTMIYNLTKLALFDLFRNNITGNLSSFTGDFPKLTTLDVSQNQLSGDLPGSLFSSATATVSWSRIERYYNISRNKLVGRLPELQGDGWLIDLSHNNLGGPLPSFSNCSLYALVLAGNKFTGSIPAGLQNSRPTVQALDLSFNNFTGKVPTYLGDMKSLQALDLTSNSFEGSFPETLGDCWNLQHLRVSNNSLRGAIPTFIGKAGSLGVVAMSNNSLTGSIPPSLGNSKRLKFLDLSNNNLTGTLPASFQKLSRSLRALSVASNRLSGPFPPWLMTGNFKSLQWLDFSKNSFHGNLPSNFSQLRGFINMTGNTDTVKESITLSAKGNTLHLPYLTPVRTALDVSSNYFSGQIPSQLGERVALKYLSLASNSLSGEIPAELGNLQEVESMDLSSNALNGTIPPALGIDGLSYFNVSNNFLTGPIPTGSRFSPDYFRNNSGLCTDIQCNNPTCMNEDLPQCNQTSATPLADQHYSDGGGHFRQWVSMYAFYMGFGMAFFVVTVTMVVSGSTRSRLLFPWGQPRWRFDHSQPYGAYNPRP